jgi:hypothetical protein
VIIIGVPATGVSAYGGDDLSDDLNSVCQDLVQTFQAGSVRKVVALCDKEKTTYENVEKTLNAHFGESLRGQVTLLFFLSHGEPDTNGDVRLLMSNTTDDTRSTLSLRMVGRIVPWMAGAKDSTVLAFVDACYSSPALVWPLGIQGALSTYNGASLGLMVSSQSYQKSYNFSFTKALIQTWKAGCPQDPYTFVSQILTKTANTSSWPQWLITFPGSACYMDLVSPTRRIVGIWRDPNERVLTQIMDVWVAKTS